MLKLHCYQLLNADKEISLLHPMIDLVITLGGDGTVLWVKSQSQSLSLHLCVLSLFMINNMERLH